LSRTRDGLDSVLEEARDIGEKTDNEDCRDRGSGRTLVDEWLEEQRPRYGQVATSSHRDRQPGARQDEGVDDRSAIQPVDEVERLSDVDNTAVEQKSVWKQRRTQDKIYVSIFAEWP